MNGSYQLTNLSFDTCKFKILNANSAKFGKLYFSKCTFGSDDKNQSIPYVTYFNNAKFFNTTEFKECVFWNSPKFHGATFHFDTSFHRSKFRNVKSLESIGAYRVLKQAMHELGAEHDFMNFHALEMEARRNIALPKFSQFWHPEWAATFSSWFLKITNDYGRNYWYPLLWIVFWTLIFGYIYYRFDLVGCDSYNTNTAELWQRAICNIEEPHKATVAMTYALQKSLGPVSLFLDSGAIDARTGIAKVLTVFQVLFSSVYWYVLIVQIRRQFRL